MAALATSLTEFADNADSRTYTVTGHTVTKPKLVIQRRKVPSSISGVAESSIRVVYGTVDSSGATLQQRVSFEIICRTPVQGAAADVAAALVVIRDIVACDEYTALVSSQGWVKA